MANRPAPALNDKAILAQLKKLGTAQNRKVYCRHGAGDNIYGVSWAHLRSMAKKIGKNQEMARELWQSGNSDAQSLALLIADPQAIRVAELQAWIQSVHFYLLADLLGNLAARTPSAATIMTSWQKSSHDMTRAAGYVLLAVRLKEGHDLSVTILRKVLTTIVKEIHTSPNNAKQAMNQCLIAIGIYRPKLQAIVFKAAEKIGVVEIDHGETDCKTPDAISYIKRASERKK